MKVIHIITGLDVGGAELVLSNLTEAITSNKCKSLVICLKDKGEIGDKIEKSGVPVIPLSINRGFNIFFFIYRIIYIIKKEKPDIINTWLYHADLVGFIVGKICGIRNIIWNIRCANIDIDTFPLKKRILIAVNSFLSKYIQCIVVNSKAGMEWHIKKGYKPCSWRYIPNGFDLDKWCFKRDARNRIRKELDIGASDFVIGMVARYDPLKDHHSFISAMSIVKSKYPNIKIIMIGKYVDSKNDVLSNLIAEYDLTGNIYLLGVKYNIADYYPVLDILVSSSITEGFPNVVAEAMACEIPCVSTNVGDAAYIISDAGKLVPIKDPDALAKKVIEFIETEPDRRKMQGVMARKRIQENFSLSTMANNYKNIYESLIY